MTTLCANHVCKKDLTDKVLCPLCRQAEYCSEACRKTDWVKHACPNAMISASPNQCVVRPYVWEEDIPDDILNEEIGGNAAHELLQAHTTTHFTNDGRVQGDYFPPALIDAAAEGGVKPETLFGSYKRGTEPRKDQKPLKYRVVISQVDRNERPIRGNTLEFKGIIGEDAIYKENNAERVKRLLQTDPAEGNIFAKAKRFFKRRIDERLKGAEIIIWPNLVTDDYNTRMRKSKVLNQTGNLKASLEVLTYNATTKEDEYLLVSTLNGPYNFIIKSNFWEKLTRSIRKLFLQRLKLKLQEDSDAVKTMRTYVMEAPKTTTARFVITIQRSGEDIYVRDVEVTMSPLDLDKNIATSAYDDTAHEIDMRIGVDPSSISQMTGLVMCLETRAAEGNAQAAADSAQLRPYTRDLNTAGSIHEDQIPDKIHTIVYSTVNRLASEKSDV